MGGGQSSGWEKGEREWVEAALRIKDDFSEQELDVKVTVVTMGPEAARGVIKGGLAKGADEGVLLMDSAFSKQRSQHLRETDRSAHPEVPISLCLLHCFFVTLFVANVEMGHSHST